MVVVALVCLDQLANGAVTRAWVRRYSNVVSNAHDVTAAVVRDSAGNIIVAGYSDNGFGERDMLLLKYSANGSLLWQQRHDGVDVIYAAAVDAHGNVAVAGYTSNAQDWDYFTAKFSAEGALLWTRKYEGPSDDRALAVAFDASGNVVVTGGSSQSDYRNDDDDLTAYDYYTAKYAAADGALLWERRYNGPGNGRDLAQAVVIDASDNVVVTGASFGGSSMDYYTAKYAGADGALLWDQRYHGPGVDNRAKTVALDAAGNVVVGGSSWSNEGNYDAHTIKYAGTNGAFLWERRYNGPANFGDAVQSVAVDGSGNVIVTGYSTDSLFYEDAYTAKYAAADGAVLWERLYGPTNRSASGQALAVDASGNVVMAGYSLSNHWDHYTAKYAAADGALLWERLQDGPRHIYERLKSTVVLDENGNVVVGGGAGAYDPDIYIAKYATTDGSVLWEQRYAGLSRAAGVGECVAIDASGNVIVSGSSEGNDSGLDYYTAKYSPHGVLLWESRYDSPHHGGDYVRAMALDADGNVAVTGYSQGERAFDFYTVKYAASDGAVLWERRYDGTGGWDDHPQALAVDSNGNVIVTGFSTGTNVYGPYTAKYAAATGALLWEKHANFFGGIGGQAAVTVDGSGNVIVTGHHTVKYAAANGAVLWSRDFVGDGVAVKADSNGNVVVTGHSQGYYTAKYAAANGALLWEKRHTSPAGVARPSALAVDAQGNAIVTGGSYDLDSSGIHTVKYASADGAVLWERRYDAGSNGTSIAKAVAVDESGNVVVAGFAPNGLNHDYFTAKYAAADGAVLWEQLFDGQDGREDRVENRCGLALGPNGMVAVTGVADGYLGGSYGYAITTVVYRDALEPISIAMVPAGVRLRFMGEPGRRYTIQRAPAITGLWETIATPEAPPNGQIEHLDSNPLPGSAFYRTTKP
jgi:uncharacterized delta-60 repeat protein